MITQEKFDSAYRRIAEMRDEATACCQSALKDESAYDRACGREQAFAQVLCLLENAEAEMNQPAG